MTDTAGLTRLTVNLVPRALAALDLAAEHTGDSRTDIVNRALQVYAAVVRAGVGEVVAYDHGPDVMRQLLVADPTVIPAGLDARPTVRWTVHCSHCGRAMRDEDGDYDALYNGEALARLRSYDVSGWEFDVDGRTLVCEECRVGWCEGCQDEVTPWQARRVDSRGDVWHPACADKPCERCAGDGVESQYDAVVGREIRRPCKECGQAGRQGPGAEFEVPGEPSKTPPVAMAARST